MHEKIMNDFDEMLALETGATANKNENQVVGQLLLVAKHKHITNDRNQKSNK